MKKETTVVFIIRGGIWLYASMIVNNLGGFIYWIMISKVAGSIILGLTSATIGIATLLSGLLSLGIGLGLQHFIGLCLGNEDIECVRSRYWCMIHFSLIIYIISSIALILLGKFGFSIGNYTPEMLTMAGLILFSGFIPVVSSIAVSFLRTDILFIATVIGNILKVGIGVSLVYMGYGYLGAIIGYIFLQISQVFILLIYAIKKLGYSFFFSLNIALNVLKGSIINWIPSIVLLAGQWLGVIFVFGSKGAVETGYYYIAFTLANFILGIGTSMLRLLLPVLSSLNKGKILAVNIVIRISLSLLFPFSLYLAIYPNLLLGILGKDYLNASKELSILLINSVAIVIVSAINSLIYSDQKYSKVLLLGLSQNLPRMILYLFLVPMCSSLGAAISYTIGSYSGLVYSLYLIKRMHLKIDLNTTLKIIIIPIVLMIPFVFISNWILGIISLVLSYLFYFKYNIISKKDLSEILLALKLF